MTINRVFILALAVFGFVLMLIVKEQARALRNAEERLEKVEVKHEDLAHYVLVVRDE